MTLQSPVYVSTAPDDGQGDKLRDAFIKINERFKDVETAQAAGISEIYQGARAVDPTVRGDLTPLQEGDFYFNTALATPAFKVYIDGVWVVAPDIMAASLAATTGSSLVGFQQAGTGAVPTTVQTKLRETVSVMDFGAVGNGTTDDTAAIQAAFDSGARLIYVPFGSYLISSAITVSNDNVKVYGSVKGNSSYRFLSTANIEQFKVYGDYVEFQGLCFDCTNASHSYRHIQSYSAVSLQVVDCLFNGADSITATGSGVGFGDGSGGIGGSIGIVDRCVFNHSSVDVATWDVHIVNSWVWANSRQYAIRAVGAVGNLTINCTDVLPPDVSRTDRKAAIYLSGAVLQPIISSCYIDGNANLNLGYGILAENGVLGLTIDSLRANVCTQEPIVLDSVIAPIVKGCTFYNNNKAGIGAADILMRQTFTQALEKPVIVANSFIQTVAGTGTRAAAIKLDSGASKSGIRIEQNSIQQPGTGGGYIDQEIDMAGGFTTPSQGTLRQNQCTRKQCSVLGTNTFAISDTFNTVTLPATMMYQPRPDQCRVNFVGAPLPYRVQVISDTQIGIGFTAAGSSGTIYVHVDLD
jgi:hypothetical protein